MKKFGRAIIVSETFDSPEKLGFLSLLQPPNPTYPQFGETYQLPGGKLEPQDRDDTRLTAVRECWEELGITIDPRDLAYWKTIHGKSSEHDLYLVRRVQGKMHMENTGENHGVAIFGAATQVPNILLMPSVLEVKRTLQQQRDFFPYSTEGLTIPDEFIRMVPSKETLEGIIPYELQQKEWTNWEIDAEMRRGIPPLNRS